MAEEWCLMTRDGLRILWEEGGFGVPLANKRVAVFSTRADAENAARAFGVLSLYKAVRWTDADRL